MSKRSKRRQGPQREIREPAEPGEAGGARQDEPRLQARARHASDWSLAVQLAFVIAVFAVVVLIAELAGAANLGVALGVGQIAFAIAVIYLLVRR